MRKKMTVTIKSKPNLVVPESVRRAAGFKNGERLEFKVSGRMVTILSKPEAVSPGGALTPADAKKLRHSLKQVKEGENDSLA